MKRVNARRNAVVIEIPKSMRELSEEECSIVTGGCEEDGILDAIIDFFTGGDDEDEDEEDSGCADDIPIWWQLVTYGING